MALALVTEEQLSASQRDTVKKARTAEQRANYDYTIALMQQILKENPGFMDGRRFLRETAIKKAGGPPKMLGALSSSVSNAGTIVKAQSAAKKTPLEALLLVEQVLAADPFNRQANTLLTQIGEELHCLEICYLALETIRRGAPTDLKNLHQLGDLYLKNKDPRAIEIFEAAVKAKSNDGESISKLKSAQATLTMLKGGWESAKSYRDVIADKDQAIALEQANKITRSDEAVDMLIAQNYEKLQAEPASVLIARKIADLYKQKGDLENALVYYNYTWDLTSKSDPGIERVIYELKLKQLDDLIKQWAEYIAANPDAPELPEHEQTLAGIRAQRAGIVLDECRSRVAKYPNELQFKFELGEALFTAGDIGAAIPELQASLRQPNIRLKAIVLLAKCFKSKGQFDIAAKRLEEAATEVVGMDDQKKELLYELGSVREEMGDQAAALEAFKQIYEVDYGYRNGEVARKVESA